MKNDNKPASHLARVCCLHYKNAFTWISLVRISLSYKITCMYTNVLAGKKDKYIHVFIYFHVILINLSIFCMYVYIK